MCCDSWGRKELDTTELLIWTELKYLRSTNLTWSFAIHFWFCFICWTEDVMSHLQLENHVLCFWAMSLYNFLLISSLQFVSYLECLLNGCGISWINPLSLHLFSPFPLFSSFFFLKKKKKCITLSSSNSTELCISYHSCRASLVAQMIKSLPAMWETWVWFLGWEDSLEKGMATNSRILAWRISWTE